MSFPVVERFLFPFRFEPQQLKDDLNKIGESEWIGHFNRNDYEGDWSIAPLRQPASAIHPIQAVYSDPNGGEYVDGPLLARCGYFASVLRSFQCRINAARLMRLHAGAVIREHTDHGLAFEDGEARVHVPVTTNPDVAFYLKGERVEMKEGEAWYLNFSLPHSVVNSGSTDRVHLVIDCVVNDWLKEQFGLPGNV